MFSHRYKSYLAVCVDLDDQKWEENFMDNLVHDTTEEESDVDEEFDISLPSSKIKSYREVIQSLERSQIFLDSRGCLEAATHASSLIIIIILLLLLYSTQRQKVSRE